MNRRIDYMDIARGIAVFLMVVGHGYTYATNSEGGMIVRWLYSFHMPLFFISSGVLYGLKNQSGKKPRFQMKNKCKTLLMPYFIWSTLYQLFLSVLSIIGGKAPKDALSHYLPMVLQFTGTAMWFLPVMFLAGALFFLTLYCKNGGVLLPVAYMLAGIYLPESGHILPVILRACVGAGFIAIGFYAAKVFDKRIAWQYVGVLAVLHLIAALMNDTVSLAGRSFSNPILYILISALGTLWIFDAAKCCKADWIPVRLLKYWGKNSIKVLCFHEYIIQVLRIADHKWFGNTLLSMGWAEGIAVSVIVMTILTLLLPLINALLNWSFGVGRKD